MSNITLKIPDELKEKMQKHPEVNWSAVIRKSMQEHLNKMAIVERIAQKSKFTQKDVDELDKLVKRGIAKAHGL